MTTEIDHLYRWLVSTDEHLKRFTSSENGEGVEAFLEDLLWEHTVAFVNGPLKGIISDRSKNFIQYLSYPLYSHFKAGEGEKLKWIQQCPLYFGGQDDQQAASAIARYSILYDGFLEQTTGFSFAGFAGNQGWGANPDDAPPRFVVFEYCDEGETQLITQFENDVLHFRIPSGQAGADVQAYAKGLETAMNQEFIPVMFKGAGAPIKAQFFKWFLALRTTPTFVAAKEAVTGWVSRQASSLVEPLTAALAEHSALSALRGQIEDLSKFMAVNAALGFRRLIYVPYRTLEPTFESQSVRVISWGGVVLSMDDSVDLSWNNLHFLRRPDRAAGIDPKLAATLASTKMFVDVSTSRASIGDWKHYQNAYQVRVLRAIEREFQKHVLSRAAVKNWKGVYVLGCFEKRKTFYSQQVRALDLCRVLAESGKLDGVNDAAIVGGGAGGMTAALALTVLGIKTTLFESAASLLHMQSAATTRYLHPHIYDWPVSGSLEKKAGLPFLNWEADMANAVARQLLKQWHEFDDCPGREVKLGQKVSRISKESGKIRLHVASDPLTHLFDVVVVASGFGAEVSNRYWDSDQLDNASTSPTKKVVAISGSGDGGLIDLARASIRSSPDVSHCRHDDLVTWLTKEGAIADIGNSMHLIDQSISDGANLYNAYNEIEISCSTLEKIRELRRQDTIVHFRYKRDGIFRLDTALINRLIALLLIRGGMVQSYEADAASWLVLNAQISLEHHGVVPPVLLQGFRDDDLVTIRLVCEAFPDVPKLSESSKRFWEERLKIHRLHCPPKPAS